MKKTLLLSALSLALLGSAAHAADTATLKVAGRLTNAACTPTMSDAGVADYGKIYLGNLSATATNQLGQKNITLSINCTAATKVAWRFMDNRAGTRPLGIEVANADVSGAATTDSVRTNGFGKTAGGVKLGGWALYVDLPNLKANGVAVDFLEGDNTLTHAWQKSTTGAVKNTSGNEFWYSTATTGSLEALAITNAVFPLVVSAAVQNTATLAITDDTPLDGEATITLAYL
ncbi:MULTISPECIES: DUF1120 domain-containing protein [unclassified Citrobacter]|uniref:DUF1120 domain-containing protein n=1 Tax=unclassified Citrobacter TaxID=2644389 RepID=UPI001B3642C1|nr:MULTISPECIES: DUF1120 domain-containing protein [unclassified Citrobacter]MBP8540935.1 DUF1120 domain-containing protein [Citrobacter sp. On2M]MBW5275774.1 DUF1120 domain-containing protein [Citrobacter sp. On28M]